MIDELDAAMQVMEAAFDPVWGEAWTRKQVSDALTLPTTHLLLADITGENPVRPEQAVGFALSRGAAGEEELLLIAVMPAARGNGVGRLLLQRLERQALGRGTERLFLEMRDGNPAEQLYLRCGFEQVGLRKNYYRRSHHGPLDAKTFAKDLVAPT